MRIWLVLVVLATPLGVRADNSFLATHPPLCSPFLEVQDPAVVRVQSSGPDETRYCSGVVISPTQVLTAKHCLCLGDDITVNGVEIVSWALPELQDLALLTVKEPFEKWHSVTASVPLALMLEGYGCTGALLQRSAILLYDLGVEIKIGGCVCHGDSGGAVLDDDGRLVAIIVSTFEDGKQGYAEIPVFFLNELRD